MRLLLKAPLDCFKGKQTGNHPFYFCVIFWGKGDADAFFCRQTRTEPDMKRGVPPKRLGFQISFPTPPPPPILGITARAKDTDSLEGLAVQLLLPDLLLTQGLRLPLLEAVAMFTASIAVSKGSQKET